MDDYKIIRHSITTEADLSLFPTIKELAEKYKGSEFDSEGDSIVYIDTTAGIKYVYTRGKQGAATESKELSIDTHGASWFREMRGDGVADEQIRAANHWQALIDKLPVAFYAKNPILYYEDIRTDFNVDPEIDANIRAVVGTFFDENSVTVSEDTGVTTQLIYAASLRLALGVSLVPQPVLGKVYFSLNDGTLKFLTKQEAKKLEDVLQHVRSGENSGTPPEKTQINTIVNTLTNMLSGRDHLEKYLLFNDDNEAVIEKITEKQRGEKRAGDVPVDVLKVTVNTIILLKVKANEYNVYFNRFTRCKDPVLRAKVFFDKVTLTCASCRDREEMISANTIDYKTSSGHIATVEIAFDKGEVILLRNGRRLTEEEYATAVEEIKESVFSKHLRRVECPACAARDACVGYVCEDQRLNVKDLASDGEIETKMRCAECVYPESYVLVNGEPYTTSSVFFDANERRLRLRADDLGGRSCCSVCARPFYREKGSLGELCDLCASLSTLDEGQLRKQEALYKKYAGLLPLRKRLTGESKRCVEDQSVIVFKVGRVYHVFDKLAAVIAGENYLKGKSVTPDGWDEV